MKWSVAVASLILFTSIADAAPKTETEEIKPVASCPVDANPSTKLAAIKNGVLVLQENADAGIITKAQADDGTTRYLDKASQVAGHAVKLDELLAVEDVTTQSSPAQLTALQRFAGYITFVNILWVIAIVVGAISLVYFFGSIFLDLLKVLKDIPLVVYELLFYAASLGVAIYGKTLQPETAPYVGLTSCMLFAGALGFSTYARKLTRNTTQFSLILTVVWSIMALIYTSPLIGFIAVGALMAAVGFSAAVIPLGYVLGFEDEAALGRATSVAFGILILFGVLRAIGTHVPALAVFENGALFLGSFVGYLGLLISSSRWYEGKRYHYITFQIITIVMGIVALLAGSVFDIGELQKIGGTFFVLYIIEKFTEIPAESARGYAAVGIVVSGVIYGFCAFIKSYPELVQPYFFVTF